MPPSARNNSSGSRPSRRWVYATRVELEKKERERAAAERRVSQPSSAQVVREPSSVVPEAPSLWTQVNEVWIDGRVLSRVGKSAIVQGNGPPTLAHGGPTAGGCKALYSSTKTTV